MPVYDSSMLRIIKWESAYLGSQIPTEGQLRIISHTSVGKRGRFIGVSCHKHTARNRSVMVKSWVSGDTPIIPTLETQRQADPWAHWPASLTYMLHFLLVRNPDSKIVGSPSEEWQPRLLSSSCPMRSPPPPHNYWTKQDSSLGKVKNKKKDTMH